MTFRIHCEWNACSGAWELGRNYTSMALETCECGACGCLRKSERERERGGGGRRKRGNIIMCVRACVLVCACVCV